MKQYFIRFAWLFSISMLVFGSACKTKPKKTGGPMQKIEANPMPMEDLGTDSLKRYLDAERENRIKKK